MRRRTLRYRRLPFGVVLPQVRWEDDWDYNQALKENVRTFMRFRVFGKRLRIRKKRVKTYVRFMLIGAAMDKYIRTRLEEPSWARMILPVRDVRNIAAEE